MQSKLWRAAAVVLAGSLLITASIASTTTYEYDVQGRLKKVTREDGTVIVYTWDDATNRTQLATYIAPGMPPSISVPSSSSTGSYTVSWGAVSGTITAYQLYETTNTSSWPPTPVYSGTSTSFGVSGKGNGTYYYRVRACNNIPCSGYREGANGTTVLLPASAPPWITVPSTSSTGSFTVSWGASSGVVSSYQLYEATNAGFSGEVLVHNNTGTSHAASRGPGTYFYRVRACNGSGCSNFLPGANSVTVPQPIQVLNPPISVHWTGQTTSITTLANLNGHSGTIHSFTLQSCWVASATIQSGAQSVYWTNGNYYDDCGGYTDVQCSASYVIRNSGNGQLHNGSSVITIVDQWQPLPPGYNCP